MDFQPRVYIYDDRKLSQMMRPIRSTAGAALHRRSRSLRPCISSSRCTMTLRTLLAITLIHISSTIVASPRTLDSVPLPTTLSLPLTQNQTSKCFVESQVFQGPTVDQWGRGLYYGPIEQVNRTTRTSAEKGSAVWGQPSIQLADGTRCCENLSQVRDYINYLDSTIISYLAIRQQFVVEAGRFKNSRKDVRAVERAVDVVKRAEELASQHSLAPWIANVSYTALLNSFTGE
ncbi:hypothetical protein DFH28DRAFT_720519 [Melampsora americana]|nr:hypothetical protein DFH28DRAFT_720519 [Melampsora americana]